MSVSENITNGKYRVGLPYPCRTSAHCPNPECGVVTKKAKFCPECGTETRIEQRLAEARDQLQAYRAEEHRLMDLFKTDALAEVGLAGVPNADDIYNYAWEQSHSSGLMEVMTTLEEISELVIGSWARFR